jgi:hypothetical protein
MEQEIGSIQTPSGPTLILSTGKASFKDIFPHNTTENGSYTVIQGQIETVQPHGILKTKIWKRELGFYRLSQAKQGFYQQKKSFFWVYTVSNTLEMVLTQSSKVRLRQSNNMRFSKQKYGRENWADRDSVRPSKDSITGKGSFLQLGFIFNMAVVGFGFSLNPDASANQIKKDRMN